MFDSIIDVFTSQAAIVSLLVLTILEIVLGIDNIVFLSIVVGRAPQEKQRYVRNVGLIMAMFLRIIMLFGLSFIVANEKTPLFTIYDFDLSIKDIILFIGGLFLIAKSTSEIHHKITEAMHPEEEKKEKKNSGNKLSNLFIQIALINIIFSIDSILTAVGLTSDFLKAGKEAEAMAIMIMGVVFSTIVMMLVAGKVGEFINNNPTIIMLALSFLIMIGTLLIADALHFHIPRGYVYFAMGFSLFVEILNLLLLKNISKRKKDS